MLSHPHAHTHTHTHTHTHIYMYTAYPQPFTSDKNWFRVIHIPYEQILYTDAVIWGKIWAICSFWFGEQFFYSEKKKNFV